MIKILMVCTGNICRSPMAEVLLKHIWPESSEESLEVNSAGTHALYGHEATPEAIQAMNEYGIDLTRHRARLLTNRMLREANLILVMEQFHIDYIDSVSVEMENVLLLSRFASHYGILNVPDPYGGSLETYRGCAQIIKDCLEGLVRGVHEEDFLLAENSQP